MNYSFLKLNDFLIYLRNFVALYLFNTEGFYFLEPNDGKHSKGDIGNHCFLPEERTKD